MFTIQLTNGKSYPNDPALGLNLDTPAEVEEILDDVGIYRLMTKTEGLVTLWAKDVESIG